ncbi:MAG: carboxypeptidase-like regulatory domain-containing protein, partial [Saprospiraceae bacterium]|nr:carboxypeptidase-like regulatory domain-containing protein [Saprospiraceae bacterium]
MKHYLAILFFIACSVAAGAQQDNTASTAEKPKSLLIQFSGMLLTEEGGRLRPVPYATVYLPNKNRGTYSDYRGFFTLVVEKGDKVRFTCIGLESVTITVP